MSEAGLLDMKKRVESGSNVARNAASAPVAMEQVPKPVPGNLAEMIARLFDPLGGVDLQRYVGEGAALEQHQDRTCS
jgi:hypothetical protein